MDALCIYKNDIHQLAAELIPSASVSFSLDWIGNAKKEIAVDVTRTDAFGGIHRWKVLRFLVGDKMSFTTMEAKTIDNPIESFTVEDLVNLARQKPKMTPRKKVRTPVQEIGDLHCQVNNKHLFSFHLNSRNMLSVEFVWLGDRTGRFVMDIGSEVTPKPKLPKMRFGDEVTFRTTDRK